METIRNYLETMFANYPNTAEVLRAKQELGQMMEDKYNELLAEGKTPNEAVGTVIAEFGNLEELADDLGLRKETEEVCELMEVSPRRNISFDEVKDFLHDASIRSLGIALGVALCILCPIGPILADAVITNRVLSGFAGVLGLVFLFVLIAVAVAIFIIIGIWGERWDFLHKELCSIDYATAQFLHNERSRYRATYAAQLTVGIIACVVCWIPVAIFDEIPMIKAVPIMQSLGVTILLMMVAGGVFMIIHSSIYMGAYDTLLKLNDRNTVSGRYVPEQEESYDNPVADGILSVYWPTVRCIYLAWSFLTFAWWKTWIIWPLAAAVHAVCKSILGNGKNRSET